MTKITGDNRTLALVSLFTASAIALYLISCESQSAPEVYEQVPSIVPITNNPALRGYAIEFAKRGGSTGATSPLQNDIPVSIDRIDGKIWSVRQATNAALWLIRSYKGENWRENQKLYLYSDKTKIVKLVILVNLSVSWIPLSVLT